MDRNDWLGLAKFAGIAFVLLFVGDALSVGLARAGAYDVLMWLPLAFVAALVFVHVGRALVHHLRRR